MYSLLDGVSNRQIMWSGIKGGWGEPEIVRAQICKPFKAPRNRFPAWRLGTTTLFDVPARQAT
jgi:hypothetical protein